MHEIEAKKLNIKPYVYIHIYIIHVYTRGNCLNKKNTFLSDFIYNASSEIVVVEDVLVSNKGRLRYCTLGRLSLSVF